MTITPIPYFGAKTRMAPHIASRLPPHDHYIEVFGGSMAVLLAKQPSSLETVNDIDKSLITFWRVLRDQPDELVRVCALTPHSRAEFIDALPVEAEDDIETARRVFVRLTQGRAGRISSTGWRYAITGRRTDNNGQPAPLVVDRHVARLVEAAGRLRYVQIECLPALDLVTRYGAEETNCLYLDPPYLGITRNKQYGYRYEMAGEDDHRELGAALGACKAAVVVSGYRSELYDDIYRGWYVEEFPTQTTQGGQEKPTCEVLWSNRMLGGRVQLPLWTDNAADDDDGYVTLEYHLAKDAGRRLHERGR